MQSTSIRTTLLAIRDEFRQLFLKYPPLHHERFTSPLEVTSEGWRAFAEANFTGPEKGHWYVAQGNLWLGRFTGVEEGLPDFLRLCHQLGKVVFDERKGSLAARSEWLDVVHDLAELRATPLLSGNVLPWKFGITQEADWWDEDGADLFCDAEIAQFDRDVEGGGLLHRLTERLIKASALLGLGQTNVLDGLPVSYEQWDHRSGEENRFPSEPFVGSLDNDLFRASAAAIDILLQPEELFIWRPYTPEVMPFDLSDITGPAAPTNSSGQSEFVTDLSRIDEEQRPPAVSSQSVNAAVSNRSDYEFFNPGNFWRIRFPNGNTFEEAEFSESKGLEFYWRLIQQLGRTVQSTDLSPHGTESEGSRAASSVERGFTGLSEEGGRRTAKFTKLEMEELKNRIKELTKWLESESDSTKRKGINHELRIAKREFYTEAEHFQNSTADNQAKGRVKRNLGLARLVLRKKMPRLVAHLEAYVETSGKGWIYAPSPTIEWRLSKDE